MNQEMSLRVKEGKICDYMSSKEMFCGDNWYFRARKRVLTQFITSAVHTGSRVLDIGCGHGWLKEALPGRHIFGVETDKDLKREAELRDMKVFESIPRIVHEKDLFDSVTCFDVLEHLPDEDKALQEIKNILKPEGSLFVSVPLHPEMWSVHDENAHHFKRYRKGEIITLLEKHRFNVIRRRYYLSSPLFIIYTARMLFPGRETGMNVPGWVDPLLYWLTVFDSGLRLPFGLTEIIEARMRKPI